VNIRLSCAVVLAALALSACGGTSSSGIASSDTSPAPSSAASATATNKPLSFYAAQYLRIGKPCTEAQAKLKSAKSDSDAIARGKEVASACQDSNAALLRASWPSNILVDIRALVVADGPVIADFNDLANNSDSVVRDSGAANAAANIVRADLGLPAIK
jgi:hypothetical protein